MKFLLTFLFFLTFNLINISAAYDSLDEFYDSIPIDKNDKSGLYLDYIDNYKYDDPQKAVAISRNSLTKEINWDDYTFGIGYGYETIKGARKAALYECNYDLYPNEECIILIENNEVILKRSEVNKIIKKDISRDIIDERLSKLKKYEDKYGFRCEWIKWNKKNSLNYIECLEEYKNIDFLKKQAENKKILEEKNKKISEENKIQQEKEIKKQLAELEIKYGAKCLSFGFKKSDQGYPKCMMTMMRDEESAAQMKLQNEIKLAEIELRIAEAEAKNKELDAKLAKQQIDTAKAEAKNKELDAKLAKQQLDAAKAEAKNQELDAKLAKQQLDKEAALKDAAIKATIAAQRAADEQTRQTNALIKRQIEIEERKAQQEESEMWFELMEYGFGMAYPQTQNRKSVCRTIDMGWIEETTCD